MVRIRSEHAIGFLKGRFQSLKHLRIWINNKQAHKFATYWVLACIAVHCFAMGCEEDERGEDDDPADDPFVSEGLGSEAPRAEHRDQNTPRLQAGRALREKLKEDLFCALRNRTWGNHL